MINDLKESYPSRSQENWTSWTKDTFYIKNILVDPFQSYNFPEKLFLVVKSGDGKMDTLWWLWLEEGEELEGSRKLKELK